MRLPNGDRAIVDIRKLRDYCLNPRHWRGRNKARVFASTGIREPDAEVLRSALLEAAASADSQQGSQDEFELRFAMAEMESRSVVALLQDLSEHGLVRGRVGAVVDDNGRTYATQTYPAAP